MNKVAYNSCFGSYILSPIALERLAALGHSDPYTLPRHHPHLVAVVELLGGAASAEYSYIKVKEIAGDTYKIESYDGQETVLTPEDITWIKI